MNEQDIDFLRAFYLAKIGSCNHSSEDIKSFVQILFKASRNPLLSWELQRACDFAELILSVLRRLPEPEKQKILAILNEKQGSDEF